MRGAAWCGSARRGKAPSGKERQSMVPGIIPAIIKGENDFVKVD
jgi:hypothetical protein